MDIMTIVSWSILSWFCFALNSCYITPCDSDNGNRSSKCRWQTPCWATGQKLCCQAQGLKIHELDVNPNNGISPQAGWTGSLNKNKTLIIKKGLLEFKIYIFESLQCIWLHFYLTFIIMDTIVWLQEPKLQEKCWFSLEMAKWQKLEVNFSGARGFQGHSGSSQCKFQESCTSAWITH